MTLTRLATRASAFAGALLLFAACDPGTRIEGAITIVEGLEAPDDDRHTMYVGAFREEDVTGGVLGTAAVPVFIEFSGIENEDFNPEVEFALGGAGNAEPLWLVTWWKIGNAVLPDYERPDPGDRYGVYAANPVFEDESGNSGGTVRSVDIVIDTTLVESTAFAPTVN